MFALVIFIISLLISWLLLRNSSPPRVLWHYHSDWSPTLRQQLPILLPKLLQFYSTLKYWYSSHPVHHHLLFSLRYFPTVLSPTPYDSNLPLKSILLLRMSPKSRPVRISSYPPNISTGTSNSCLGLTSTPSFSVLPLVLRITSQNINTIHLVVLTRNLGVIHLFSLSSPCNQSLNSFDSTFLISLQSSYLHSIHSHHFQAPNWFSSYQTLAYRSAVGSHLPQIKI